ncbi:FMRFamide receptor-like [Tubulanus polymorphus]|uniref:FMRFamide receptor-like n=1 Tax=Tubulanus polymorphus TaxID=672921 RepID=UPI003DA1CB8A
MAAHINASLSFNVTVVTGVTAVIGGFKPHPRCKYIHHSDYKPFHVNAFYQVANWVVASVAAFGVFLNVLSYAILRKDNGKNTSIFYLKYLAILDACMCASYLLFDFQNKLYSHTLLLDHTLQFNHLIKRTYPYTQKIRFYFSGAADLLILIIAVDRFIVVRWPLKASALISLKRARYNAIGITIIMAAISCPWFFQKWAKRSTNPCTGHERWSIRITAFNRSRNYRLYMLFVYTPVFHIVPSATVLVLTANIIKILKSTTNTRKHMTSSTILSRNKDERSLTIALVIICCIYLVKRSLLMSGMVNNYLIYKNGLRGSLLSGIGHYMDFAKDLTRKCSASANFFVYVASRKKFRHQLNEMLYIIKRL